MSVFIFTIGMLLVGQSISYAQTNLEESDRHGNVQDSGCPAYTHDCVPFYQCLDGEINTSGIGLIDVRSKVQSECTPQDNPDVPGLCCRIPGATTPTPPIQACRDGLVCIEKEQCSIDGTVKTDGAGIIDKRNKFIFKPCYLKPGLPVTGVCCQPPVAPPLDQCYGKQVCLPEEQCVTDTEGERVGNDNYNACYINKADYITGICCDPPIRVIEVCPGNSVCIPEELCQGEILDHTNSYTPYKNGGTWSPCSLHRDHLNGGVCCRNPVEKDRHYRPAKKCGIRNFVSDVRSGAKLRTNLAQFGEFPWQAIVFYSNYTYKCGASLITDQWVLTAAHCVEGYQNGDFKIRLGEWQVDLYDEPLPYIDVEIASIIVYPQFQPENLHNDIAAIELATPVKLEYHINTVCLPSPNQAVLLGTRCFATGWGKDAFEGDYQPILKKVDLPFVEYRNCEKLLRRTRLGRYFKLHESFMCAGGEKNKDACTGDGGGPLVCKDPVTGAYFLRGITAWGINCGQKNIPGVYTDVQHFSRWIEDLIY